MSITNRLKKVILLCLKLKDFDFQDDTKAYQVPGWDSLSHVSILSAIEKEYSIRFSLAEVLKLNNIGDLQRLVDSKIEGKTG